MYYYAQINENGICIGISSLKGENQTENMIQIPEYNEDYLWRKYENGQWSTEKFEPESTAPITEFEQLKSDLKATQEALDFILLNQMPTI